MAYCDIQDVINVYGEVNVYKWADLNGDGNINTDPYNTEVIDRINYAINLQAEEIDDKLRFGLYSLPFDPIPLCIINLNATLAGIWLYNIRGLDDEKSGKLMDQHNKLAQIELDEIKSGRKRFEQVPQINTAPQIPHRKHRPLNYWEDGFYREGPFWT
jgi:phage gp36-like protein